MVTLLIFPKQTHIPAHILAGKQLSETLGKGYLPIVGLFHMLEPFTRGEPLSINQKLLFIGGREVSLSSGNKDKRGIKRAKYLYY